MTEPGQPKLSGNGLGLNQAPFEPGVDPRFFYAEPGIMQRLDLLTHLTQFSETLLVVVGPEGSGKSTLLEQFVSHGHESWRVCRLKGHSRLTEEDLYQSLAEGLGLGVVNGSLAEEAMERCRALGEVAQLPVLVVDDADQVPAELLDEILSLGGDPQKTVQQLRIILFGDLALEQVLRQSRFAVILENLQQTLDIPGYPEPQAAAYLMYRLTVAGYSGQSPFTGTEVKAIWKAAGGLPGEMSRLAREALQDHVQTEAAVADFRVGSRQHLLPMLAAGGVAALLVAAWLWMPGSGEMESEPESEPVVVAPAMEQMALNLPDPSRTGLVDSPEPAQPDPIPVEAERVEAPVPSSSPAVQPVPETGEHTGASPAADGNATPAASGPEPVVEPSPEPEAEPASPAPEPEPAAAETVQTEPAAPVPVPEPAPEPPQADPQPQPEAPPAQAPVRVLEQPPFPLREQWIRDQPAYRFTLQLFGTRSEDAVRGYADRFKLEGDVAYFVRELKGSDWYTLIYGSYRDRAAAEAAVAKLPAEIRKAKPWPRLFKDVQALLPDSTSN